MGLGPLDPKISDSIAAYQYPKISILWDVQKSHIGNTIIIQEKPHDHYIPLELIWTAKEEDGHTNLEGCSDGNKIYYISEGAIVVQYTGIRVTDANGKDLRFMLYTSNGSNPQWQIDDHGATYPLRIEGRLDVFPKTTETISCDMFLTKPDFSAIWSQPIQ